MTFADICIRAEIRRQRDEVIAEVSAEEMARHRERMRSFEEAHGPAPVVWHSRVHFLQTLLANGGDAFHG